MIGSATIPNSNWRASGYSIQGIIENTCADGIASATIPNTAWRSASYDIQAIVGKLADTDIATATIPSSGWRPSGYSIQTFNIMCGGEDIYCPTYAWAEFENTTVRYKKFEPDPYNPGRMDLSYPTVSVTGTLPPKIKVPYANREVYPPKYLPPVDCCDRSYGHRFWYNLSLKSPWDPDPSDQQYWTDHNGDQQRLEAGLHFGTTGLESYLNIRLYATNSYWSESNISSPSLWGNPNPYHNMNVVWTDNAYVPCPEPGTRVTLTPDGNYRQYTTICSDPWDPTTCVDYYHTTNSGNVDIYLK